MKTSHDDKNQVQENLQEKYLESLDQLEEGQLIEGEVVQINSDHVFVDVGYKMEGFIPVSEFNILPLMGDKIEVLLIKKEGRGGQVILSKTKADSQRVWKMVKEAFNSGGKVHGEIIRTVKGGYSVSLGGQLTAFLPMSKADTFHIGDPESLVGIESDFLVERLYNDKKVNIVVSRRKLMEEEARKKKEDFFATVQIGDDVEGIVKNFTSFGAFIDLGGFDGLLHNHDMSWGHVSRPKDFVDKGDKLVLKVIHMDPEKKNINLSLKHFSQDPWTTFEERYSVNDIVRGKVTKIVDFGAFVELEEGIEGLIYIAELSWVKHIKHPREILKVGDEVEVRVLGYDIPEGKISLGMKQLLPNPWDEIPQKYPIGSKMTRPIKKLLPSGIIVELEEGIDGFISAHDLSWSNKTQNPSNTYKVDDEIEAMVTEINTEKHQIRLSVKDLSQDIWKEFDQLAENHTPIKGKVTSKSSFGIFIAVKDDIEGLIPKSHLLLEPGETQDQALEKVKEGDEVEAIIIEVTPSRKKLVLSIKEKMFSLQKKEMSKYMNMETNDTFTLGDILKKD